MRQESDAQRKSVSTSWQAAQSSRTEVARNNVDLLEDSKPKEEHAMTGSGAAWLQREAMAFHWTIVAAATGADLCMKPPSIA